MSSWLPGTLTLEARGEALSAQGNPDGDEGGAGSCNKERGGRRGQ